MPRARRSALRLVVTGLLVCASSPALGQQDSTVVVPGREYRAGRVYRFLLGDDYRDLWTTPIRAEILDLSHFAGGLKPIRDGGRQTRSLRFEGADGREYTFRSVNKDQIGTHEGISRILLGSILQDQISSLHPTAALVASPLLDAAGVLHASPRLVVMPDSPALGTFRGKLAGMLGIIEEHPNEGKDDTPGFAGSRQIVGTERMLEYLQSDPRSRVDRRAYLTARLMDIFLGDWDRHADQWRWARFDRGGVHWWVPIPRDRDYAFVNYDGLLPRLAGLLVPKIVRFDREYKDLPHLLVDSRSLDKRFLKDLPKPVWDSVVTALQRKLSDQAIRAAVRQMPRQHYTRNGAKLTRILRARRNRLPRAADRFFNLLHWGS